ncbi:S-layer homology domain-containing protein, partial [Paenibacillus sepulcri]|nr:S-layer homology domain-containing protein [Paenibacillus sepulcri]
AARGLVEGINDKEFRPNEPITREQLSVLLLRALQMTGVEQEAGNLLETLQRYQDREAISAWSESAVAAVTDMGIMEGRSAAGFVPKGSATRAEAAVVLMRMLQHAGYINR